MLKTMVAMLCGLMMFSGVAAEVLIKESEARLPKLSTNSVPTRAITRGPGIRVLSPQVDSQSLTSPFLLRIAFEPRGGAKIDPSSVSLIYLRSNGIDLTERVRSGLSEKGIELKAAEVPAGEHQIRISVQDDAGRLAATVLTLNVVE